MRLLAVTIEKFKNIVEPQRIDIEHDVTGLVGKNESGKTTVLKALHRLNPANGTGREFNVTTEYPRWRLAPDRRKSGLESVRPVVAEFEPEPADLSALDGVFPVALPEGATCFAARSYANDGLHVWLTCDIEPVMRAAALEVSLDSADLADLLKLDSIEAAQATAKSKAKDLKDGGEPLRAKAVASFVAAIGRYSYLFDTAELTQEMCDALATRVPKFFYFSNYDVLPGECNLTALTEKIEAGTTPSDSERTVVALLAHAGEKPRDFMDADYDSRKAELQAASTDLSRQVFKYWRQNPDLAVVFDTDNVVVGHHPEGGEIVHRYLKIELRDDRHGGVETNFSTRSSGFQWFFSFFAAFSEYQSSEEPIVVLLDEPGTSLHGEAQKDFVRFIFEELGASKQTLYTTHSQFMVDPARYEVLRAVHDRATREDPDQGVAITRIDLAADRDTVLPVESALGYSISQHLFVGSGQHLAVEGSSDFVYAQRLTEYLTAKGRTGLDPRLAIIPVGGDGNMPAFVAILGRRLKVSALIDGAKTSSKMERVKAAARDNGVPESAIVACSQVSKTLPANADIEDLFEVEDYLWLYNKAFGTAVATADLPATSEPISRRLEEVRGKFDHALPAHALTDHRDEFFANVRPETLNRFEKLFELLNGTVTS
jgi:energy-coupling factor transporter ATP-binding protein EcfA2